ncbi:MAG TPA: hypothetical protein VG733_17485 [Chthoniobacteraceae bacterium]|nr:hypothetical protein [Chthoniobacteraceae bacterium]
MMAPAFSSPRQAAAFGLMLLAIVALPAIMGKSLLPSREEIYTSTPWEFGPYHSLRQQIFGDKSDIDIAFVGSSRILHDIDTPYVQKALSEKLGRDATVVTLGWNWAGFDAEYFIAKDLLAHRKVAMIVFTEESRAGDDPQHAAPHWFRFGDDAAEIGGLPFHFKAAYYMAAIQGMPRNLLSLIRPNSPQQSPASTTAAWRSVRGEDPTRRLGSIASKLGFMHNFTSFEFYTPPRAASAADAVVYSPETKGDFQFSNDASALQLYFERKFAALAAEHHSKLVCLNLPETPDAQSPVIREKQFWPGTMQADVAMLGVPPAKLFAGMTGDDILKLFLDPYHFNLNGQEYFTPAVTPDLLRLYDSATSH